MKLWSIVFFLLPLLATGYVSWRVWHIMPWGSWVSGVAVALVWLGMFVMIGNFVIGLDRVPMTLAKVLYHFGTSWFIVMLYLVMIFLLLDIGRLCHVVPHSFVINSLTGTLSVCILMTGVFTYAYLHYKNKVRVEIELQSHKINDNEQDTKANEQEIKTIVMMSDLHLGYHNGRKELARWVDMINMENPDLILIAGDVIDISVRPLIEEDMAKELRRLKAPVYACLGNHEYYSGEPKAQQFFRDAEIHLLRDSVVNIANICVIGRDDRTNVHRQALGKIMKQVDRSRYTILLDHQPYNLEQAEKAGVDFQFSGHTHHGQVWPISWIAERIYEDAFGPYQRGNTRYYVSSGIGIWGGKFRIGTQSEYVVAKLNTKR